MRHKLSTIARDLFTNAHKPNCADVLRAIAVLGRCKPYEYPKGIELKLSSDTGEWLCSVRERSGKPIAIEIGNSPGNAVMRLLRKLAGKERSNDESMLGVRRTV